jgi:XTP/dITP diphosphohydrolase
VQLGPGFSQSIDEERTLKRILVATSNPGKVREYEELLASLSVPLEITFPAQEGLFMEAEESGESFEENARIKALAFSRASGLLTLADDSGLEVDALDGAPGVRSARYAGPDASDTDRYRKLLEALREVGPGKRGARFRCVVALAQPDGAVYTATGTCEGHIAFAPRGAHGFGYDPVFVVEGYGGQTMAELAPDEKNRISHRARAVMAARPVLTQLLTNDSEL